MMTFLTPAAREEILKAARAAGLDKVQCRQTWLKAQLTLSESPYPVFWVVPGPQAIAKLGCESGPCVDLFVVADAVITVDWVLV